MNDSSFLHTNVKATINRKAKNIWFVLGFLFKLFPTTWTYYKFQLPSPWNECVRRADRHSKTMSFDPATERSPKQSPSSLAAAQTFIPAISPSPQQFRGKKEKEIAPSPNQPSLKQYSLPLKKKKKMRWVAESLGRVVLPRRSTISPILRPSQEEKAGMAQTQTQTPSFSRTATLPGLRF